MTSQIFHLALGALAFSAVWFVPSIVRAQAGNPYFMSQQQFQQRMQMSQQNAPNNIGTSDGGGGNPYLPEGRRRILLREHKPVRR